MLDSGSIPIFEARLEGLDWWIRAPVVEAGLRWIFDEYETVCFWLFEQLVYCLLLTLASSGRKWFVGIELPQEGYLQCRTKGM